MRCPTAARPMMSGLMVRSLMVRSLMVCSPTLLWPTVPGQRVLSRTVLWRTGSPRAAVGRLLRPRRPRVFRHPPSPPGRRGDRRGGAAGFWGTGSWAVGSAGSRSGQRLTVPSVSRVGFATHCRHEFCATSNAGRQFPTAAPTVPLRCFEPIGPPCREPPISMLVVTGGVQKRSCLIA